MTDILISAMDIIAAERYAPYTGEEHIFSKRFERRIRRLSGRADIRLRFGRIEKRVPFRKAVTFAIIVVLTAVITIGTAANSQLWESFFVDAHNDHTMLHIQDIDTAPQNIKEKYRLSIDLSDYSETVIGDDELGFMAQYSHNKENKLLLFEQATKVCYENVRLDTENAIENLSEVYIHDKKGFFFITKKDEMVIIWDNGDYIIQVNGLGFGKDELISIAESVQQVE